MAKVGQKQPEKQSEASKSSNVSLYTLCAAIVVVLACLSTTRVWSSGATPEIASSVSVSSPIGGVSPETKARATEVAELLKKFPKCKDKNPECTAWADRGECDVNPGYMKFSCAISCRTCEEATEPYEQRCRRKYGHFTEQAVLKPFDLYRIFDQAANLSQYGPRMVHRDPPVLVFDNILSHEEADALAAIGENAGYERSSDAGQVQEDGSFDRVVSKSRTSENSWCNRKECADDEMVMRIQNRLAEVSQVPYPNHEFLQMLRYQPGQYYVPHHDFIPGHVAMPCGPRIMTFFLYLSEVEEGGFTAFSKLKDGDGNELKITPKKGSALLWPNVYNAEPFKKDPRTHHEAVPVKSGMKLAANAWIHMHNFREPNAGGCTG